MSDYAFYGFFHVAISNLINSKFFVVYFAISI